VRTLGIEAAWLAVFSRRRAAGLAGRRALLRGGGRMTALVRKYFSIWVRTASMAMQAQLTYRLGSFGFLVGKMIRLVFFFAFVVAIFQHVQTIAGYNLVETALFFLTFNVVDMTAQILFRGVYGARRIVSEGDFDFYLIQPCDPLFRMVFSTVDFLDIVTLIPVLIMVGMVFARLPPLGWTRYAAYSILVVNGVALVFSIHVFVAGVAVRTQELENAIWIYRDVMFMGKFPVDVYAPAVRWALTFGVPIAVMTSFPAKALLGILSPAWAAYGVILTAVLLALSARYWRGSVARYTSSSS
jgi:ABC-2 type transport system permease protein